MIKIIKILLTYYYHSKILIKETFGSVIYKAKGTKSPDATLTRVENKPSTNPTQPTDNSQDIKENKTNKKTTSVKTGDETNVVIFASLSMVSGGLFLVLRKEYERVH